MKNNVSCNPRTALSSFIKHAKNQKPQDIFLGWANEIHVTTHYTLKSLFWLTRELKNTAKNRVWTSFTWGKDWISARVHARGVCWSCRCITHRKARCAGGKKITAINNNSKDIVLELNCIYVVKTPDTSYRLHASESELISGYLGILFL